MTTINISPNITITLTPPFILPHDYIRFGIIQGILKKILLPYMFVIAVIGLFTNTSTVILLSKNYITKNLKNKWSLIALALSDLLFNIALLIHAIHDTLKAGYEPLCVIISFLSHLAEFLSAWYTVSYTIQRYSAVHYPFEAAVQSSGSSTIISLFFIFILSSIYSFVISKLNVYEQCHEELTLGWFIADALLSFVIPFSLILIFNILIVNFIRKHSHSPISVQSNLLRKATLSKNSYKRYNRDDTCETDNFPVTNITATYIQSDENGNENVEIQCLKDEKRLSIEMDNRAGHASFSSSLDRANSETSFTRHHSNSVSHSLILSKTNSRNKKELPTDSFFNRVSAKSSYQSNDNELVARMSTKTFQSIRVTRMLVLVSTCFLILNAPSHLCMIAMKMYANTNAKPPNEHNDVQQQQNFTLNNETISSSSQHAGILEGHLAIHLLYMAILFAHFLAYASYSINFFLYSYSGITFRTSLRQLIDKFRRH